MGKPKPIVVSASPVDRVTGRSIIAGRAASDPPPDAGRLTHTFKAVDPSTGREIDVKRFAATEEQVDEACKKAWEAFHAMLDFSAKDRAHLLDRAADEVSRLGDELVTTASSETGFGPVRLVAEKERCVSTLRSFAQMARDGSWCRAVIDLAEPNRRPLPKPDVRRMERGVGPVALFAPASSPIASGVAGGDVASALAAGCPVICKGHPGHPGTAEMLGWAMARAVQDSGFHPGTYSMLHSGTTRQRETAERLVLHPCVRAVGFSGRMQTGEGLRALVRARGDEIRFCATYGTANPVFILPSAIDSGAESIARNIAESIVNANGQSCMKPGLIFVIRRGESETLVRALARVLDEAHPEPMVSSHARGQFGLHLHAMTAAPGVEIRGGSPQGGHGGGATSVGMPINASPVLLRCSLEAFRAAGALHEEVFGPAAVVVVCESEAELLAGASTILGAQAGTIWAAAADTQLAGRVETILMQRVGRIIFNTATTSLEPLASLVHGGPFPASTMASMTATGPDSIYRWTRPVCFQNAPDALLPAELRDGNPLGIERRVAGELTREAVKGKAVKSVAA